MSCSFFVIIFWIISFRRSHLSAKYLWFCRTVLISVFPSYSNLSCNLMLSKEILSSVCHTGWDVGSSTPFPIQIHNSLPVMINSLIAMNYLTTRNWIHLSLCIVHAFSNRTVLFLLHNFCTILHWYHLHFKVHLWVSSLLTWSIITGVPALLRKPYSVSPFWVTLRITSLKPSFLPGSTVNSAWTNTIPMVFSGLLLSCNRYKHPLCLSPPGHQRSGLLHPQAANTTFL